MKMDVVLKKGTYFTGVLLGISATEVSVQTNPNSDKPSKFDIRDVQALWRVPGGDRVATNQLLYNLGRRGIEWDLLPWLRERGVPVMAYSPIEQARLLGEPRLVKFAKSRDIAPSQAALAWLLQKEGVIVIPKTGRRERLRENLGALAVEGLEELDRLFPPPAGPQPLDML